MRITLDDLRARPKEDRQVIATFASCAVMGVLLLGWSVSSIGIFRPNTADESQTAAAADAISDRSAPAASNATVDANASMFSSSPAVPSMRTNGVKTGTIVTLPTGSNND